MIPSLRCLFVALLITVGAAYGSPAVAEGAAAQSAEAALRQIESNVSTSTLSNGLRVVWYRRAGAPVFSGAVVVRVGGVDEPQGKTGIAHLFEHMAFKGTSTVGTKNYRREKRLLAELESIEYPASKGEKLTSAQEQRKQELYKELESLWVQDAFTVQYDEWGAVGQNATTGKELTRYFVDLPTRAFEFWCQQESERLIDPVMRQFYSERDVVLEERRMRFENSVAGKLYENILSVAFSQHPYRQPIIGYEADVRRLTATELQEFYQKYYVSSNMTVGIVGEVNPEQLLPLVERYFGRIPRGEKPATNFPVEPPQEGERRVELRKGSSPMVEVGYHKPAYPSDDDVALGLAADILVGSATSPVFRALVHERKLAVEISYSDGPGQMFPSLLGFSMVPVKGVSAETLLQAFDDELARQLHAGFTAQQLVEAKRRMKVLLLSSFKDPTEIALSLATSELIYGSWRENVRWFDRVQGMPLAQVVATARKYLVRNERVVGIVNPK